MEGVSGDKSTSAARLAASQGSRIGATDEGAADLYTRSARVNRGLEDLTYPFHDQTITVTSCGRIWFQRQKVNLSQVFAGQKVGVTPLDDETCRLEPIDNPFGRKCYLCAWNERSPSVP